MTPRLTEHARQRCREMDVRTKRVKRVLRAPEIVYPSDRVDDALVAVGDGLAIPYLTDAGGTPVALTVLWHGIEFVRPEHRGA